MLICANCRSDWLKVGNQWTRIDGKVDYRCECGSKKKPIEKEKDQEVADSHVEFTHNLTHNSATHKRILVISDTHCGAISGLTPPSWFVNESNIKRREIQQEAWNWYKETIADIEPVDILVCNGDMIEGKGKRSGGTELLTTDLFQQVKIAEECIKEIDFKDVFFVTGTNYHVSNDGDDFETSLADKFNAQLKDHLWLNVNKCIFDFKHKTNSSSVLQSRVTALIKEYMWSREWSKNEAAPKSDVFVRSHVHYNMSVTDHESFLAVTTPALQVADTKFGSRICTGTVDFGCVLFEVPEWYSNVNDVKMTVYKTQLDSMKSESIEV